MKIVGLKTFIAQCNGFNKVNRQKAFNRIDALCPKPHWKPSEEQMEELGKAKDIYMKSSSGIASLYYDLKTKLM